MEIKNNQIVKLRNGVYGVVTSFNNVPEMIIFKTYSNPVSHYDADLKKKNELYDIMQIYDGSSVPNMKTVFSTKFSAEDLPLIWERTEA